MKKKIISFSIKTHDDFRYPVFLFSLVIYLFLPAMFGSENRQIMDRILFIVFILTTLILVRSQSKKVLWFTYCVGIMGVTAEIVNYFILPLTSDFRVIFIVVLFVYFISLFYELVAQIFKSENITLNVVLGAFTGYIMIGIIGFFVFRIIFLFNPMSFSISQDSAQDLIYFSFITLTTIGYGDISPLTDPARNFAIILGLVGQFYNTVIIAIIIGKFLQK